MTTTFEQMFASLEAHTGKPVFLTVAGAGQPLRAGRHAVTIFDYFSMPDDDKGVFVESQLMELALTMGRGWTRKVAPFALVGGESHPVPEDELDQQCDGVLLLDLENGEGADCPVLFYADPTLSEAKRLGLLSTLSFGP
jgi:hypothetical protein